jgi:hypothetical protein
VNTTDPSDYAPLHNGPGLALGLMLILGRAAGPKARRPRRPNLRRGMAGVATGLAAVPAQVAWREPEPACPTHGAGAAT